jgi:hypothetical protein
MLSFVYVKCCIKPIGLGTVIQIDVMQIVIVLSVVAPTRVTHTEKKLYA